MGYKIKMINGLPEMSYDPDPSIATDLLLSAMVPQGSFFLAPSLGLRPLPKKLTDGTIGLVRDYFRESAKWLLDAGKAKSIDVIAERDDDERGRVNVQETAVQANDNVAEFETFVGVI